MYEYNCTVTRVVDGDTIDVILDLGFSIFHKCRVRLYGIDTPESRTRDKDEKARGLLAKSYIVDKVESTENIIIRTKKDAKGKFGRILGELIVDNTNLHEAMISKHLGVAYYGQSKEAIEAEHLKNKEILINNNAYQPVI